MHIDHQTKGQGGSFLASNLNLSTSIIYSFVDAIAQGILVCRSPKRELDFPLILLRYTAVGWCGTNDWLL